ncbi:hypothetical protein SKAU_G00252660 [Synaphobranchus kaupii]|uniref:Cadherin domain-containing protein n=1 Tax=Synaphobranchus kaupii TaxID=118154 RepID=A0A9Q1IR39_SYNKA|nr:hypothetical protein SKAU_G00252660 [Synaphobranchus kaupii]
MRQNDGLLTVGEIIDREQLCPRSTRCLVTFDIVAFAKEKFQLIHVEIEVKDINDNSPKFPLNETYLEISENMAVGSRFPLDVALDQDVGSNYIQIYQISLNSYFGIEVREEDDGIKHAQLVLVKSLDREAEDFYTLQVTAMDGGSPHRTGSMTVHIRVLDFNDNSPTFELNSLKVELYEDAPVGFLILKVHAFDPDDGINGEVLYAFVEESLDEVKQTFQIDPFSGSVTLKALVDYETKRSYQLNIQAYDLGLNSISSTCEVVIEIVDVNDNLPEISIKPVTSMSDGVAYITESAAEESFVALISTSDRDSGSNGYVRCSLHGHEHFKLQVAYGDTVMIVTTTTLDRERIPEYNLTVVAEDLGSPPFKTIKHYTIRVTDDNDNVPLFSKAVYEVSVVENNIPGSYVLTVVARDLDMGDNGKCLYLSTPSGYLVLRLKARDADKGVNSELIFQILEDEQKLFSINKDSGEIVLKYGLTSMCGDVLRIKIAVSDNGRSPLSSSATVLFVVTEMQPLEDQIVAILQSIDEEKSELDVSLIIIVILGGGCALLLIAIVTVALSCKLNHKGKNYDSKKNSTSGPFGRSALPVHKLQDSNVFAGPSVLVNEQIASSRHESSELYEERRRDTQTKVSLPSFSKAFEPVALWQCDEYSLQLSGTADQLSVKDSGKGDSDFNDSDSDISGDACRRNGSAPPPRANSTFHPAGTLAVDRQNRYCAIPTHTTVACGNAYTVAFSRVSTAYNSPRSNPTSWRESGYQTSVSRGLTRLQGVSASHTLPSYSQQGHHSGMNPDARQQGHGVTTTALTEVATSF